MGRDWGGFPAWAGALAAPAWWLGRRWFLDRPPADVGRDRIQDLKQYVRELEHGLEAVREQLKKLGGSGSEE